MTTSRWSIAKMALFSAAQFGRLTAARMLHLRHDRLGERYAIDQGGTYAIFRETVCDREIVGRGVVLVVGFRLRLLRAHPFLHWIFQRLCILTTPFWSGLPGFRIKLWMVEPDTKDYLGIYAWAGEEEARTYVNALDRVLRPLSTRDSVWFTLYPDQALDAYLRIRKQERPLSVSS